MNATTKSFVPVECAKGLTRFQRLPSNRIPTFGRGLRISIKSCDDDSGSLNICLVPELQHHFESLFALQVFSVNRCQSLCWWSWYSSTFFVAVKYILSSVIGIQIPNSASIKQILPNKAAPFFELYEITTPTFETVKCGKIIALRMGFAYSRSTIIEVHLKFFTMCCCRSLELGYRAIGACARSNRSRRQLRRGIFTWLLGFPGEF